jgi:hypothetical protein
MYRDRVNCVGGDQFDGTQQFMGSVDEFYVFSKELKQDEIETFSPGTNS